MKSDVPHRPVIYGEVLFDCFEDGEAVLGGAPFNVAWHLQGFGLAPHFISRIGRDPLGERILEAMAAWGMDGGGIQRDAALPTGEVTVRTVDGEPDFDIRSDQAYDHIRADDARHGVREISPAILYHGTLALRAEGSRRALHVLVSAFPHVPRFVDINLRPPWWTPPVVGESLHGASWVKLNRDELATLGGAGEGADVEPAARDFRRRHALDALIVTRGAQGALLCTEKDLLAAPPVVVEDLVDTVGAGDAFSAVAILGRLRGWAPHTILERAAQFAADLCRVRGATLHDPDFYQTHLRRWGRDEAAPA